MYKNYTNNKKNYTILKKESKMKKILAFTLSEVLIALVIIGIIAAITVPMLFANSNEQAVKSALRKDFSVISQALKKYYMDNGEHFFTYNGDEVHKFFTTYFNVAKDCYIGQCTDESIKYKNYGNKESTWMKYPERQSLILDDGTYITYNWNENGAPVFTVDVNGPYKKPNKLGVDTFAFSIKKEYNLGPYFDSPLDEYYCNPNRTTFGNGLGCTAKVLRYK